MIEADKYYILKEPFPLEPFPLDCTHLSYTINYGQQCEQLGTNVCVRNHSFFNGKFSIYRIYHSVHDGILIDDMNYRIPIDEEKEKCFEEYDFVIEDKVKALCEKLMLKSTNPFFSIHLAPYMVSDDKTYYVCLIESAYGIGENQFDLIRVCYSKYKQIKIETFFKNKLLLDGCYGGCFIDSFSKYRYVK